MVTCYPFRWVGTAPKRFVIQARMERKARAGAKAG